MCRVFPLKIKICNKVFVVVIFFKTPCHRLLEKSIFKSVFTSLHSQIQYGLKIVYSHRTGFIDRRDTIATEARNHLFVSLLTAFHQ